MKVAKELGFWGCSNFSGPSIVSGDGVFWRWQDELFLISPTGRLLGGGKPVTWLLGSAERFVIKCPLSTGIIVIGGNEEICRGKEDWAEFRWRAASLDSTTFADTSSFYMDPSASLDIEALKVGVCKVCRLAGLRKMSAPSHLPLCRRFGDQRCHC